MGISHYIKEIGRGARGAKPLAREQAADLFGQVLDGNVTDLEIGAFCLAMRIKGETPQEMAGFLDATHARLVPVPPGERALVSLPSYNGARKLPVLTPLLALLRSIAAGEVAFAPTELLNPALKRLLDVRRVVGLRNPAHSVTKLIRPTAGPCVVVASYTQPEYARTNGETFELVGATALLSRGLEGEVVSDPRRTAQIDGFVHGERIELQAQQPGTAPEVEGLPTEIDIATTAAYTRAVLAGEAPLPPAIARQVEFIVGLAARA